MELIDADKVLNIVIGYCPDDDGSCSKAGTDLREMLDEIEALPEIDAEPVKHGRWIDNNNKTWSCSICQSWIPDEQHSYARHCLYCGAKMDGGADNEND